MIPASPQDLHGEQVGGPCLLQLPVDVSGDEQRAERGDRSPARMMPWKATAKARVFGAWSPTTDPFLTPRAAIAPAVASTMSCGSP